jgi:predicted ATPase
MATAGTTATTPPPPNKPPATGAVRNYLAQKLVMLRKFSFRNFKQFKHEVPVDFEPITVLLGANNSGKSTVLQALSIFQYCLETVRQKKNQQILLETTTVAPEEFGPLPMTSPSDLWPSGKTNTPISLKAAFDGGTELGFEIKFNFNRFSITPQPDGVLPASLEKWKLRYVPIHSGLATREEGLLAPARNDRLRLQQHGSVIRNLLWDLKVNHAKRWKRLLDVLSELYPATKVNVSFDHDVDRYIGTGYSDRKLEKELDLIVAGTGFQQVLQIFSSALGQGSSLVLLDEPDAHIHAKLQAAMMNVFTELVREEGMQFILATHSPHLLAAAPAGALRVMIEGKAHPFAVTANQIETLDKLGAIDRMEVVPLLRTKSVVFVEDRDDRKFLELFARREWGEEKTRSVFDGLTFLYTYQNPIDAQAHVRAKQVRDLLGTDALQGLAGGRIPRFFVLGDRDYRTAEQTRSDQKAILKAGKGMKLELKCHLWRYNEIENYLIDRSAVENALLENLRDKAQADALRAYLQEAWTRLLEAQKEGVKERIADLLQKKDRSLDFPNASRLAGEMMVAEWQDGCALCDAKAILGSIRHELTTNGFQTRLEEKTVIAKLTEVPEDVLRVLKLLKVHSSNTPKKKSRKQAPAAVPAPAVAHA